MQLNSQMRSHLWKEVFTHCCHIFSMQVIVLLSQPDQGLLFQGISALLFFFTHAEMCAVVTSHNIYCILRRSNCRYQFSRCDWSYCQLCPSFKDSFHLTKSIQNQIQQGLPSNFIHAKHNWMLIAQYHPVLPCGKLCVRYVFRLIYVLTLICHARIQKYSHIQVLQTNVNTDTVRFIF